MVQKESSQEQKRTVCDGPWCGSATATVMRTAATRWAAARVLVAAVGSETVLVGGGGRGGVVRPTYPQRGARRTGGRPVPVVRLHLCL